MYLSCHCQSADVQCPSVWSSSILDTLLSESTSWFRQNSDSSDFYLLGTFDPNLFIFCFLTFFFPQPFRNGHLCFCFAKKPRETFLYKIDVLGLMGLIVDSFDVWCECGWLSEYIHKSDHGTFGGKRICYYLE